MPKSNIPPDPAPFNPLHGGGPATVYLKIFQQLVACIDENPEFEPAVVFYMIGRASFLSLGAMRGSPLVSEMLYTLADEFATLQP